MKKITPEYIVGFVEAEGCFSVNLNLNKGKIEGVAFEFGVTQKDIEILKEIQNFADSRLPFFNKQGCKSKPGFLKLSTNKYGVSSLKVRSHIDLKQVIKKNLFLKNID